MERALRIRTIKPEFWSHPILGRQNDFTKLLAIGLLNMADDEGFFVADPHIIKSSLFPFTEDYGSITVALQDLSRHGYIDLRNHPERGSIGYVANFAKHQVVNKPSKSRIRTYWDSCSTTVGLREDYRPEQGTGNREQGACSDETALCSQEDMEKAKAIMAADAKPKPPVPLPAKSFRDFRAVHGRIHVGRDEREDWEALFRIYEWDAMHDMHESLKDDRIFLNNATQWLSKNYEVKP